MCLIGFGPLSVQHCNFVCFYLLFLQHAINHHPLSKECLHMLTGVKDENFLDDDYMDDDHIMDSADPIKVSQSLHTSLMADISAKT